MHNIIVNEGKMIDNEREKQLISFLTNQFDWANSKTIASFLDTSVRTVKYCVSELNAKYPALIYSSAKGYKINKEVSKKLLEEQNITNIPVNYEERKNYIIKTILMDNHRPTIDMLSSVLCISPVTLQNELSRMRQELSAYHLNIHTKNDTVSISGISKDKRKIIMDMINDEIKSTSFSIERTNELFVNVDLKKIENIVLSVLNKYEFFLDTYSLFNYVLHIALTLEIHKNHPSHELVDLKDQEAMTFLSAGSIKDIVMDIYNELKTVYDMDYNYYDILQASILMMTRVVTMDVDGISYNQIETLLGKDISDLLDEIIQSVYKTYSINLDNENFLIRFAFHLKNLLIRLQYNIKITNLQFSGIKNDYPLMYAVSVHVSKIITEHCGYILPEDEISYICLHVGVMMDEKKAVDGKVKAIIVCPNYFSLGKKIFKKLSEVCNDDLLISNVVTHLNSEIDLSNIELIISTENIDQSITIPHYTISPFVSQEDIQNIFALINDIKNKKIQNTIRKKLQYFFHRELFFTGFDFKTDKDAIEEICDTMVKYDYVDENYKEQIYEHERISPSSYGNIAIPHPLDNKAKSSVIAVSLNPQAIEWGNNKVNLVFMLSLKEEDKDYFSDIFEFIDSILKDEKKFRRIINIKEYDEFISYLTSMY